MERKRELITFDGGINNLLAPHLIQDNYATFITNANIVNGELASAKVAKQDPTIDFFGDRAVYFKAEDEIVSSWEDRFYVEWSGFLYWSNFEDDGSGKIQRYDGSQTLDLGGHVPPVTEPTLATDGAGLLKGEYSYCYTYLYEEVFESAPSDIKLLASVDNNKVKITFTETIPAGTIPTHRIIYRSGGLNPTFNQVEKIEISKNEYIDNTADFEISRKELKTGTNDAPPENIDMLIESSGTLFGAVKNRVHFSREGQPEYWSNYNYVELPTVVTGLGVIGEIVVAFTEENMFAIYGKNIKTITLKKLPFQYGCINKHTLQNLKGRLIWLTKMEEYDLICSFDGANVEVLNRVNQSVASSKLGSFTYDFFTDETYDGTNFEIYGSLAIGRRYFLFLKNRTVVVDFERGLQIYYMTETVYGGFEYHNAMIVSKDVGVGLRKWFRYQPSFVEKRNISYITKDFSDGSMLISKNYRKININASGKWGIVVMVDGNKVFDFDYTNGDTIFLPSGTQGKYISFSISSDKYAVIKALQYEYEVLEDGFMTVQKPTVLPTHCALSVGGASGEDYHVAFKWNIDCTIFKKGN